jgi:hypothetical protein
VRKAQVFRFIWRANAVIILAAGLCALTVAGILAATELRWVYHKRHVSDVVNTDASGRVDQTMSLGGATRISGQPWLLVGLGSNQNYQQGSFSKSAEAMRNYAFVAPSEPTRWLFDHNRFLILDATQVPGRNYDQNDAPTALVSFLVIEKDSDNNGRLTGNDDAVLVFTASRWHRPHQGARRRPQHHFRATDGRGDPGGIRIGSGLRKRGPWPEGFLSAAAGKNRLAWQCH